MQSEETTSSTVAECIQYTPLGHFPEDINFKNLISSDSFLTKEKHQLLEGLVIENVAEQFIRNPILKEAIKVLNVVTLITKGSTEKNSPSDQYCIFIWQRDASNISDYISTLQKISEGCASTTYICKEDSMKFYASKPHTSQWTPLQSYLRKKRKITDNKKIKFPLINDSSKNSERQISSILGQISPAYKDRVVDDVILPRVFKNYIIQPFFRSGWDLDRIFRYQEKLWEFELKHKYPIDNYDYFEKNGITENRYCLSFGINEGQANLIKLLAQQNLNTLHLILVKPRWSDEEAPGYLFIDEEARKKTLVIGTVLTLERINEILQGQRKKAPSKTSYNGSNETWYYRIPRNFFYVIGNYAEGTDNLAPNIIKLMNGTLTSILTTQDLLNNRIE